MARRVIDPTSASYAQAVEISDVRRLLFISGQVPADTQDNVPESFAGQARLAWRNVFAQLDRAGMTPADLVKVTIFLADREYREENAAVRHEMLRGHKPALTIIVAGIWDAAWLLEIEAIAAA